MAIKLIWLVGAVTMVVAGLYFDRYGLLFLAGYAVAQVQHG